MTATLKQLEAFVAVARTGSFSAAARVLHLSQPALTATIHKLEEQLCIALFERTSRGASVTTAGRELLPTIDRLVAELNETLVNVLSGTSPRGGIVTVACTPSVAALHLPPLVVAFKDAYPTINLVVRDAIPENRGIVGMLRAGEADLGIATPLDDAPELQFRRLFDDPLMALLPRQHPATRASTVTWVQLAAIPMIGLSYQSVVRLLVDKTFARLGISKRPVAEVSLIPTAVGMARAGMGVVVIPWTAAQTCNLAGLKVMPITEPEVLRPIGLLYRSTAELSPAARFFMEFVMVRGVAAA